MMKISKNVKMSNVESNTFSVKKVQILKNFDIFRPVSYSKLLTNHKRSSPDMMTKSKRPNHWIKPHLNEPAAYLPVVEV